MAFAQFRTFFDSTSRSIILSHRCFRRHAMVAQKVPLKRVWPNEITDQYQHAPSMPYSGPSVAEHAANVVNGSWLRRNEEEKTVRVIINPGIGGTKWLDPSQTERYETNLRLETAPHCIAHWSDRVQPQSDERTGNHRKLMDRRDRLRWKVHLSTHQSQNNRLLSNGWKHTTFFFSFVLFYFFVFFDCFLLFLFHFFFFIGKIYIIESHRSIKWNNGSVK